jgi:hypothetical protein
MIMTPGSAGACRDARGTATLRLGLLCAAALIAACSDSTSPGRTPATCVRGMLASDAEVHGTVGGDGCRVDMTSSVGYADYAIEMQQGERYLFTLLATTAWRPTLEILQPQHHDSLLVMGWFDFTGGADSLWSEILVVSPYGGTFTLRILGSSEKASAYTLRSRRCGGTAAAISGIPPFAGDGIIDAGSCVVHGDYMYSDSAKADLYVLRLGVSESKFITVKRTSGNLQPGVMVTGPFPVRGGGMSRMMATTAGDSVYMTVIGNATPGDYILAVGSGSYGSMGGYRFTVSPPP